MKNNCTKIAFDLGGVILHREALDNFVVEGSTLSVRMAVEKFGADNVYIISKAKDKYVERNLQLLEKENFFTEVGLRRQNVFFVNEYEDKAALMLKLGVTYILDDAIKVIKDCEANKLNGILFGEHDQFLK